MCLFGYELEGGGIAAVEDLDIVKETLPRPQPVAEDMKKNCLVIGGGSDIGRAVIAALSPEYDIFWTYCHTKVEQPGLGIRCDLRDEAQIRELFAGIDSLDLVVTAAFPFLEADNLSYEGYLEAEKFLRAHVLCFTLAAERMTPGGKYFNMLGQCVERGLPGGAFYSASFAFLQNLGHSVNAREGKAGTFSVCDLLLGPCDTREWDGLPEEVFERYKDKCSQFISPEQVAATVQFLNSQPVLPSTFKLDAYYGY